MGAWAAARIQALVYFVGVFCRNQVNENKALFSGSRVARAQPSALGLVLGSQRSVPFGVTAGVLSEPPPLYAGCVLWFILLFDLQQSTPKVGQVHLFQGFVAYLS